jgi:hypothetical protein
MLALKAIWLTGTSQLAKRANSSSRPPFQRFEHKRCDQRGQSDNRHAPQLIGGHRVASANDGKQQRWH